MPLPDERPRQSVANLIGRFEQQSKRNSLSGSSSPQIARTISVASHNTGDSAKDEVKEKREWPPRTIVSTDTASKPKDNESPKSPLSPKTRKGSEGFVRSPPPSSPRESLSTSVSAPVTINKISEPASATEPEPPVPPLPTTATTVGTPIKSRTSTAKIPTSKSAPDTRTPVKSPAPRTTASKRALSPPSTSRSPPIAKPLKAQLTGQSATSNTSTVRAKSRAGSNTSTPVRAKTPSMTSRPKTPSSGLYAPTAASLAKARNAAPPVPTPIRKSTSSANANAVLERLSKPTAASLSKARTASPAITSSPSRNASKPAPARGAAPARGTVKPRAGVAPARTKQDREKKADEEKAKGSKEAVGEVAVVTGAAAVAATMLEVAENDDTAIGQTAPEEVEDHYEEEQPSFTTESDVHEEESVRSDAEEIESYDDAYLDETINSDHIQTSTSLGDASFAIPENETEDAEINETFGTRVLPASPEPILNGGEPANQTATVSHSVSQEDVDVPTGIEEHTPTEQNAPYSHEHGKETTRADTQAAEELVNGNGITAGKGIAVDSGSDLASMVSMLEFTPKRPPSALSSVMDPDTAGSIPDEIPDEE